VSATETGASPAVSPGEPQSPDIADGAVRRLDPRYVPFQRVGGAIVTICLSVGLLLTAAVAWLGGGVSGWGSLLLPPVWLLVTAGLAWHSCAWPPRVYRHTSYVLDAEGIEIRSGVWWRAVTSVPRSRVQHIDVSQGPMERSYGLGRLVIYTAGTTHSRVELPGLNYDVAFALRNHLLPEGTDDAV
jgi:membrane protein YdbS with pleckstrin-like domain